MPKRKSSLIELAQEGLALSVDAGIGDLIARGEMADTAIANFKSKAKKLGWSKELLASRIVEQLNTLRTELRGVIESHVQSSAQMGYITASAEDHNTVFEWQATSDNICPDCVDRNGEQHTMEEWIYFGLPGSGQTVCRHYCKCMLVKLGDGAGAPVKIVREGGKVAALQLHESK